ncbi:hypothetical protein [Sodalinema gerasimenkoae]|uniref:hypothetical protein n=1 Tax=Sodalinema gerasimenkoae TaxID=2862348 RepID=UPI0013595A6E|nr:hypothetical protein [Sodalinema gerasimenkoae]MCC5899737.1 hypothetical protein [Phormidium sp. BM_Day4_Bin.17]UCJ12688.1 MAG: hypothetical protein JWS08_02405 [Phormidium sp. PBR-2020]
MGQPSPGKTLATMRSLVESCLESHSITHQDYLTLSCMMLSGKGLSMEEYQEINVVFDRIQLGRVRVIYR